MSTGPTPLISTSIAGKSFRDFTPEAFHTYVSQMYALPQAKRGAKVPIVRGVSLARTKSGNWSIRRSSGKAFPWISRTELESLANGYGLAMNECWNLFRAKDWMIVADRMEAERRYSAVKEIPW